VLPPRCAKQHQGATRAKAKQKDMSIDDFDGTPTSGIIGSLKNYL
jgi:hypothetical protein